MNVVVVNCFDTYEHRVDLLYKILSDAGHEVNVIESDFCHIKKVERTDKKDQYKYFHAMPYYKNLSIQRLHSHRQLSKDIFSFLQKYASDIDVLWILVPPNSFVKDAAKLKKKYTKIKIVCDLIDLWPETMPIPLIKNIWPLTIWKNLRDKYMKYVDHVVTECDLYQKVLDERLMGKQCTTLYLARELEIFDSNPNLPDNKINLCYLGSINNIIDIPAIEDVVRKILKVKPVELHIIGAGEKKDELINVIENTGAKVVYHGVVYDKKEKQLVFDQCHFGLNIMKTTVCVGLTMKSMDYFEAGLPIINNIKGDTWELVLREGIGLNYDGQADFLERIEVDRIRVRKLFEEKFSEESFKKKLLDGVFQKL